MEFKCTSIKVCFDLWEREKIWCPFVTITLLPNNRFVIIYFILKPSILSEITSIASFTLPAAFSNSFSISETFLAEPLVFISEWVTCAVLDVSSFVSDESSI